MPLLRFRLFLSPLPLYASHFAAAAAADAFAEDISFDSRRCHIIDASFHAADDAVSMDTPAAA